MSSLSCVEAKLPPGFRFHPRDEELICDYLMKWVTGGAHPFPFLIQVDLNHCEPWDIPETACVGGKEWYFYSQRDRKYATGQRTNRATISGYWKATGKDRPIVRKQTLVGMRKTLVFYEGRAPKGRKTDWVMHEFRLEGASEPGPKLFKEDWVLCRVFFKSTSENPEKLQETKSHAMKTATASSQLPPLMEPYNNPTFVHAGGDANDEYNNSHHHHEQVPCFSNIFTAPTFSFVNPPHHGKYTPASFGGMAPEINYSSPSSLMQQQHNDNPCSNCDYDDDDDDGKVIKAVLDHLTRMETVNQYQCCSFNGSPSSESYLSEVMWNNHYS